MFRSYTWSNWMHGFMAALFALAILSVLGFVDKAFSAESELEAAPQLQLRVATGKPKKGYSKFFSNIRDVCGSKVALTEVVTEGGLENVTKMAGNEADIGFAQIDTLMKMRNTDTSIGNFKMIMPLGYNLMHIVTRRDGFSSTGPKKWGVLAGETTTTVVTKFSDLKGKTVAASGSAQLLARSLNDTLGFNLNVVDVASDNEGIDQLNKGQVYALLAMSAWPHDVLKAKTSKDGLTLVSYDLSPTDPYSLITKNYPGMGVYNVKFLAVPNVVVTQPFRASGKKGQAVAVLQQCLKERLDDLQDGNYEPSWKDIQEPDTIKWPAFNGDSGSQKSVANNPAAAPQQAKARKR